VELDQGRRGDVVEPPRFVAQVTECRANPVVSRRGYLLVTDATDDAAASPVKRWGGKRAHQLRDFQLTRYLLHPFLDSILRRFASHFSSFKFQPTFHCVRFRKSSDFRL